MIGRVNDRGAVVLGLGEWSVSGSFRLIAGVFNPSHNSVSGRCSSNRTCTSRRIRLSPTWPSPSLSASRRAVRAVGRDQVSHRDTCPGIGGTRCPLCFRAAHQPSPDPSLGVFCGLFRRFSLLVPDRNIPSNLVKNELSSLNSLLWTGVIPPRSRHVMDLLERALDWTSLEGCVPTYGLPPFP